MRSQKETFRLNKAICREWQEICSLLGLTMSQLLHIGLLRARFYRLPVVQRTNSEGEKHVLDLEIEPASMILLADVMQSLGKDDVVEVIESVILDCVMELKKTGRFVIIPGNDKARTPVRSVHQDLGYVV